MKGLTEMIADIARVQVSGIEAGAASEHAHMMTYMRAIAQAYDRAKIDPGAKIPSPLMAACEACKRLVDEDNASRTLDRSIKERGERGHPAGEHDRDIFSRKLEPGA